jgi:hypothetical protein
MGKNPYGMTLEDVMGLREIFHGIFNESIILEESDDYVYTVLEKDYTFTMELLQDPKDLEVSPEVKVIATYTSEQDAAEFVAFSNSSQRWTNDRLSSWANEKFGSMNIDHEVDSETLGHYIKVRVFEVQKNELRGPMVKTGLNG